MGRGWFGQGYEAAGSLGFFPWGSLVMVGVAIALVVLLVLVLQRLGKLKRGDSPRERAIDILVERWSKGEIDTETFRAMKKELDGKA